MGSVFGRQCFVGFWLLLKSGVELGSCGIRSTIAACLRLGFFIWQFQTSGPPMQITQDNTSNRQKDCCGLIAFLVGLTFRQGFSAE